MNHKSSLKSGKMFEKKHEKANGRYNIIPGFIDSVFFKYVLAVAENLGVLRSTLTPVIP